jgi:hypothetical protein
MATKFLLKRFWRVMRLVLSITLVIEKHSYEKLNRLKEDMQNLVDESEMIEKKLATQFDNEKNLKNYFEKKLNENLGLQNKLRLSYVNNLKLTLKNEEYSKKVLDYEKSLNKLLELLKVQRGTDFSQN